MKLMLPLLVLCVVLSFCTGSMNKLFSGEPKTTPTPETAASQTPATDSSSKGGSAGAQSTPEKLEDGELITRLTDTVNDWKRAEQKGDRATLERLLADEIKITDEEGKKYNKAQWIKEVSGGDSTLLSWKIEDAKIEERTDDSATMSFNITYKFSSEAPAKAHETDKFVLRDDRWQTMSSQAAFTK